MEGSECCRRYLPDGAVARVCGGRFVEGCPQCAGVVQARIGCGNALRGSFLPCVDSALLRRYLVPIPRVRPGDENVAADCGFAAPFMPMFGVRLAATAFS